MATLEEINTSYRYMVMETRAMILKLDMLTDKITGHPMLNKLHRRSIAGLEQDDIARYLANANRLIVYEQTL